jgi:hypothetical protein
MESMKKHSASLRVIPGSLFFHALACINIITTIVD